MRSKGVLLALCVAAVAASIASAAQYRRALPGYRYEFPRDHFDHPGFQTEWWYYTGNLRARDGHRFGFELTFFRHAVDRTAGHDEVNTQAGTPQSPWTVRDVYLAHLALSDLDGKAFLHEERINRAGPGLAGANRRSGLIWNGNWSVTLPADSSAPSSSPSDPASAGLPSSSSSEPSSAGFRSAPPAPSAVSKQVLQAFATRFALRLSLSPAKPPVIHGIDGVSQKAAGAGQASHYISFTRLGAAGSLNLDGRQYEVDGSAWMDHEFFTSQLAPGQRGWDWLSLQLDDGTELMVYRLRRTNGSVDPFSAGTFVAKDGRSQHLRAGDFTMSPTGETWTSPQTRANYPIAWRVTWPSRRLDLEIRTPLPTQELAGRTGWTPTYWEGSVTAEGRQGGARLTGVGYLEMTGYDKAVELDSPGWR